jgi:hypothetical protein
MSLPVVEVFWGLHRASRAAADLYRNVPRFLFILPKPVSSMFVAPNYIFLIVCTKFRNDGLFFLKKTYNFESRFMQTRDYTSKKCVEIQLEIKDKRI